MGMITVRLPEDTHQRVKSLAASRKISINKLYEEFTIMALTEFDAENRFKALASRGDKKAWAGVVEETAEPLRRHFFIKNSQLKCS